MAANELTAKEIEAPPATEPSYQLSQRIYDSAATSPDKFQAVVKQLDQDVKSGAAPGVSVDYDTQGKVAAITINNQDLYSSSVTSIPGQLASQQLTAEVQGGDMDSALKEGRNISATLLVNAADANREILDDFGRNLGDKLKNPDLTAARQYLGHLQQSSVASAADLPGVLQNAKDSSGLGDRVAIETDGKTGAVSAFKIDGQDLLKEAPRTADQPTGKTPASADAPPADLFKDNRNDIPPAQATEKDQKDRNQFEMALARVVNHQTESLPVRPGEGYYQVVSRMHKDWSDEAIMKETHRVKDLNGRSDELKVGQRLPLISKEEKAAGIKKQIDAFDQATPDQRKQMIAQVSKQAESYAQVPSTHTHRHAAGHKILKN
jgi:uncharacterized protein YuzE